LKRRTTTLTVAGAAQAWQSKPHTCFPFILDS
jgi:hypothetical protein